MIETISISKDKQHLLIVSKALDTNQEATPLFTLTPIPINESPNILFSLNRLTGEIEDFKLLEQVVATELNSRSIRQQSLKEITEIKFKYSVPSSRFIVIIEIESGYQETQDIQYPRTRSLSNFLTDYNDVEQVVLSVDNSNTNNPTLIFSLAEELEAVAS